MNKIDGSGAGGVLDFPLLSCLSACQWDNDVAVMETFFAFALLVVLVVVAYMIHVQLDHLLQELKGFRCESSKLHSLIEAIARGVNAIEKEVSAPRRRSEELQRLSSAEAARWVDTPDKFFVVADATSGEMEIMSASSAEHVSSLLDMEIALRQKITFEPGVADRYYTILAEADSKEEAEEKLVAFKLEPAENAPLFTIF